MSIQDKIDALEQQIYVACSEGDYDTMNMLEGQLERLRQRIEHPFDTANDLDRAFDWDNEG